MSLSVERLSIESNRIPEDLIPWRKRVPEPTPETAEEYTALAEQKFAESDRAFAKFLAGKIPFGVSVFDIGSGPGIQAIELLKLRPDITNAYLLDLNEKMLINAIKRAKTEGVEDRVIPVLCDMTKVKNTKIPEGSSGFSHSAWHSLPHIWQFRKTLAGARDIIGETGALYIRDLRRPANARMARVWREEVLGVGGDENISKRELELFTNSQHAGWSIQEVQESVGAVGLEERARIITFDSPDSRYIDLEVKPKAAA